MTAEHLDPGGDVTLPVVGCARCGGMHLLRFARFTQPVVIGDVELTHWTSCPENGEPILLHFEVEHFEGEDADAEG